MLRDEDKAILAEEIDAQLQEADDTIGHLREAVKAVAPDNALGRLTRMEAIGDQNVAKAKLSQLQERRDKLKQALKRLPAENYGICAVCKNPIAMDRLLALPEARVCMTCFNRT